VKQLKALGWKTVLIAGKPAANQPPVADGHIFIGCDVVGILGDLLGVKS
jgi:hypothetical protein